MNAEKYFAYYSYMIYYRNIIVRLNETFWFQSCINYYDPVYSFSFLIFLNGQRWWIILVTNPLLQMIILFYIFVYESLNNNFKNTQKMLRTSTNIFNQQTIHYILLCCMFVPFNFFLFPYFGRKLKINTNVTVCNHHHLNWKVVFWIHSNA